MAWIVYTPPAFGVLSRARGRHRTTSDSSGIRAPSGPAAFRPAVKTWGRSPIATGAAELVIDRVPSTGFKASTAWNLVSRANPGVQRGEDRGRLAPEPPVPVEKPWELGSWKSWLIWSAVRLSSGAQEHAIDQGRGDIEARRISDETASPNRPVSNEPGVAAWTST